MGGIQNTIAIPIYRVLPYPVIYIYIYIYICVTLRGWIKSAATHFISYKVRASGTVYTDRKLLQKINFLTSSSNCLHKCKTSDGPVATVYTGAQPQMAFRGDTNYINHA